MLLVFEEREGSAVLVLSAGKSFFKVGGVWSAKGAPSATSLYNDFKMVKDDSKSEALLKEARIAVSS